MFKNFNFTLSRRSVLEITILFWIFIASFYLIHTPLHGRCMDYRGHIEYVMLIEHDHKLPFPYSGWITFHPPLYYLINTAVLHTTKLFFKPVVHVSYVNAVSVIYGGIALVIIWLMLNELAFPPSVQLLVLLLISSIPQFVFIFSTYNNDSLMTMLGMAIIYFSYKLSINWNKWLAIMLLITSVLALYTKYSTFIVIIAIIFLCLIVLLNSKNLNIKNSNRIILILIVSLLFVFPWLYFHNYKNAKEFFPVNVYKGINIASFKDIKPMDTFFRIPFIPYKYETKKWSDPWVHSEWESSPAQTKRYDFWAFNFVTSIIGEYTFSSPSAKVISLLLLSHFLIYLFSIFQVFKSAPNRLAFLLLLLMYLGQQYNNCFHFDFSKSINPGAMNFRYIAFAYLPFSVLYASLLKNSKFFKYLFIAAIFLNIFVILTVSSI